MGSYERSLNAASRLLQEAHLDHSRIIEELAGAHQRAMRQEARLRDSLAHLASLAQSVPLNAADDHAARHSASLSVRMFGRFEVALDGRLLSRWQNRKGKSILKYLLTVATRPVSQETLMELFWPELEPGPALNCLRVAVHALRRALRELGGPGVAGLVMNEDGSYFLDSVPWLDVVAFREHWQMGLQHDRAGRVAEAIHEFQEARALYRGDFLEDDPYEDWTLLPRESLKDICLTMANRLAEHCIATGDYQGCIGYCHDVLSRDRCNEEAYRRLIICYSRLGQRSRALHWYTLCCAVLEKELAMQPSPETLALKQSLLS